MKTVIIINGNVASGKSTFAGHIQAFWGNRFKTVCLDYFRHLVAREYPADLGKQANENRARNFCRESTFNFLENDGLFEGKKYEGIVFEHCGKSKWFDEMLVEFKMRGYRIIRILLDVRPEVAFQRWEYRRKDMAGEVVLPFMKGKKDREKWCFELYEYLKGIRFDLVIGQNLSKDEALKELEKLIIAVPA